MKKFWIAGFVCTMAVGLVGCSEQRSVAPPTLGASSPSAGADTGTDDAADMVSTNDAVGEDSSTVTAAKPVIDELKNEADKAVEGMKQETKEAVDAAANAAQKKKEQYSAEFSQKLSNMKGGIAELNESANKLQDDAKEEFAEMSNELSKKQEVLEGKLEELNPTSPAAAQNVVAENLFGVFLSSRFQKSSV